MPLRIPVQSVTVKPREGMPKTMKSYHPPVGKEFDFTEEEIAHFEQHSPDALKRVFRAVDDDESTQGGYYEGGGADGVYVDDGKKHRGPVVAQNGKKAKPSSPTTSQAKAAAAKLGRGNKAPPSQDDALDGL